MKTPITTLILLTCAGVLCADPPVDGIYLLSKNESAPVIINQDGEKLRVGNKQEYNITNKKMYSRNNANTMYHLELTAPHDDEISHLSHVLIVSGVAFKQCFTVITPNTDTTIGFTVFGDANAKQVSQYIRTPIIQRKHPRHTICVSITPQKNAFNIGENVCISLKINNVGDNVISFRHGEWNRGTNRNDQYTFLARLDGIQVDDVYSGSNLGERGQSRVVILKPGESFKDEVNLNKWFAFDKHGTYQILGSYHMEFSDPDPNKTGMIWDDFASAHFNIRIKHPDAPTDKSDKGKIK